MNEKEYNVANRKLAVSRAESYLRESEINFNEGYKKETAKVEQARAQMKIECGRLKEEVERNKVNLDMAKCFLQLAESELARGFDQ